ncbi:uncharacterized protein LOC117180421 [Belonocnema kinseyi]|uniref:uncharacterized protein LOC117180421 n=1 Tax=Belonocnema kinseyi TaxID=2817044 RepID=UPI00143DDF88|nr:uncharacterized protein LOC117180421 [Belonocnema kinseyi]
MTASQACQNSSQAGSKSGKKSLQKSAQQHSYVVAEEIGRSVDTKTKSRFNTYEKHLSFLLISDITVILPSSQIERDLLEIPENIRLADPEFNKPAEINALIGVQIFYKLLCVLQTEIPGHDAVLQKTHFGWIIAGDIHKKCASPLKRGFYSTMNPNRPESDSLTRFWKIEQVPTKQFFSDEENACESHLIENTKRDDNSLCLVKLPFNDKKEHLGDAYNIAENGSSL